MVQSFIHAQTIQHRRIAAGKRGFAKAVRRWLKRTDWAARHKLPVRWGVETEAEAA